MCVSEFGPLSLTVGFCCGYFESGMSSSLDSAESLPSCSSLLFFSTNRKSRGTIIKILNYLAIKLT